MGATDKTYDNRLEIARTGPGSYRQDARVNLVLGQPVTVGKLEMTYLGVSAGQLNLDIILLDLDPEYVYSRSIPAQKAKQGFTVSDYRFRAISMNKKRLRLVMGYE